MADATRGIIFSRHDLGDAQLEFARDSTGAVTGLTLVQNGARQFGKKTP